MKPLLSVLLVSASACGAVVQPTDGGSDAGIPDGGGMLLDVVAADHQACVPIRFGCSVSAQDCPRECGECVSIMAWSGNPWGGPSRVLTTACLSTLDRGAPLSRGRIRCDEPEQVAYSFGDRDEDGRCLAREQCLALLRSQPQPMEGETVRQCWSADGTIYRGSPVRQLGGCESWSPTLCTTECRCAGTKVCAFLSEESVGFGVCVEPTSPTQDVSPPCRGGSNRVDCPSGLGCLVPLRGTALEDLNRWGICVPPADCIRAFDPESAAHVYRCDLRSVPDAGL